MASSSKAPAALAPACNRDNLAEWAVGFALVLLLLVGNRCVPAMLVLLAFVAALVAIRHSTRR